MACAGRACRGQTVVSTGARRAPRAGSLPIAEHGLMGNLVTVSTNQLAGTVFGPASSVFYDTLLAYLDRGWQVLPGSAWLRAGSPGPTGPAPPPVRRYPVAWRASGPLCPAVRSAVPVGGPRSTPAGCGSLSGPTHRTTAYHLHGMTAIRPEPLGESIHPISRRSGCPLARSRFGTCFRSPSTRVQMAPVRGSPRGRDLPFCAVEYWAARFRSTVR
jgi:hypothetical protein